MKRLLLIVACLIFTGCASTNNGLRNNGKITVTGEGRTFEEAKNDAFAKAIEIAVGAVMLTDTQVKNNKLVKEEIIKHSAGYVDNYVILNKSLWGDKVTLEAEVTVRSSKIAERVLGTQSSETQFQGDQAKAMFDSYYKDRKTGDALLGPILNDYPRNAYTVKQTDKVEFMVNKHRGVWIIVPFEVRWNYTYLAALKEALAVTSDSKLPGYNQDMIVVKSKDPKAWILGSTEGFVFNDRKRADYVAGRFLGRIVVEASLKDDSGKEVFKGCEEAMFHGVHIGYPFVINGNEVAWNTVGIRVSADSPNYSKLDKVSKIELSLTTNPCYNYVQ